MIVHSLFGEFSAAIENVTFLHKGSASRLLPGLRVTP